MSTNHPSDSSQPDPQRGAATTGEGQPPEAAAGEGGAAARFQQQAKARQTSLDDYDPEEQLWTGGYSGKAMVGTWVILGLLTVLLLVAPLFIEVFTFLMAVGLIVVMWIIGGLVYAWRRLGVHYQLTSQRFIHQVGILTRKTDRIEVIDIDDVSFTQGPVERLFGVGTIVLTGSDRTHPTLAMIGISDVKQVAGLIDDVRRQERRRRSLHIESI